MSLPREIQDKYTMLKKATFAQIGLNESALQDSVDRLFASHRDNCKPKFNF